MIGHAMHFDFRALKISHDVIIDTAEVFKNPKTGQAVKLKTLCDTVLEKDIQTNYSWSHDPATDAITCIQLMKNKLQNENKLQKDGNDGEAVSKKKAKLE